MNKNYKRVCENYPLLSLVVRNAFLSEITNSPLKTKDNKEVLDALKKFKKKKRLKIIELYTSIKSETVEFTDIIPNVVRFFDDVEKLINKKK